MAGVDLTSVKEQLGHKSLKMTLRYAHLAPGHKLKAVNMLDKVLTKNTQLDNYLTIFNSEEPTTSPKSLCDNMGDTGLPSSFILQDKLTLILFTVKTISDPLLVE